MSNSASSSSIKTLLVIVAVLVGIIVALIAGILASVGGAVLSVTIASGGVAFGGALTLVLLVENALGLL